MDKYIFRKATVNDVPFIIDTIIEAEKSGTENIGLAKLFELSEQELRKYLKEALEEEIDGCELSLSSFIIADNGIEPVSAFGGWIEGRNEDDLPSAILKANLIGYIFPKEIVKKSAEKTKIVQSLQIPREKGVYELEYSYTKPDHRGRHLIGEIISLHINLARQSGIRKMHVHVFDNNKAAIEAYKRMGFTIAKKYHSNNPQTSLYFPSETELLMELTL